MNLNTDMSAFESSGRLQSLDMLLSALLIQSSFLWVLFWKFLRSSLKWYHPLNLPVKKIIYNNCKILQNDTETEKIWLHWCSWPFDEILVPAWYLSSLVLLMEVELWEAPAAFHLTYACGPSNCCTCHHIKTDTNVTTTVYPLKSAGVFLAHPPAW